MLLFLILASQFAAIFATGFVGTAETSSNPGFVAFGTEHSEYFYATLYKVPWELQDELYDGLPQYVATSDLGFVLRHEVVPMVEQKEDGSTVEKDTPIWGIWSGNVTLGYSEATGDSENFPAKEGIWILREMTEDKMIPVATKVVTLSCDDGFNNGDEEGVDCGGKFCKNKCKTCALPEEDMKSNNVLPGTCPDDYSMEHGVECNLECVDGYSIIDGAAKCDNGDVSFNVNCVKAPKLLDVEGNDLVSGDYVLVGVEDDGPVYMSTSIPPDFGVEVLIKTDNSTMWSFVLFADAVNGAAVVSYRESPKQPHLEDDAAWMVYDVDGTVLDANYIEGEVKISEATCNDGKRNGDEAALDCGGSSKGCRKCGSCKVTLSDMKGPGNCPDDLDLPHGKWCAGECPDEHFLFGEVWQCEDGEMKGNLSCVEVPTLIEIDNFKNEISHLNGKYQLLFARPIYEESSRPVFVKLNDQTPVLVYRPDLEAWSLQSTLSAGEEPLAWAKDKDTSPRTPLEIEDSAWQVGVPEIVQ
eukprot:GHVL01032189.1.p1 GENE.GHVL01032189.1~~GHVL01032189.1.p1  ORF type:complete len:526 (+),score=98.08 GHVL01032189.1:663-2240(+)